MTDLVDRVREFDRRLLGQETKHRQAEKALKAHEKQADVYAAKIEKLSKAIEILQIAGQARREEFRDRVETLVTQGLQAVFRRKDYRFGFDVRVQRQRFGAHPHLYSDYKGRELKASIIEGHGGGVADVVSFLLRVVVMCLQRPSVAPVLILDESFRHVSPDCLRGVAQLLRELNRTIGVQFILVTHKEELLDAADVIYRAKLQDGRTVFTCEHDLKDEVYHARPLIHQGRARHDPYEGIVVEKWDQVPKVQSSTEDVLARKQRHPDYRRRKQQSKPAKKRRREQARAAKKARKVAEKAKKKRKKKKSLRCRKLKNRGDP